MRTSTKTLLVIIAALLIGAFAIPLSLKLSPSEQINAIGSFTGAIAGIGTLYFAFLLYDRFGVSKKIVDKNFDVVMELLEELKGMRLFSDTLVEGKSVMFHQIFISKDMSFYKSDISIAENSNVVMNIHDYSDGTENLVRLAKHLWMPEEISKKMHFLVFSMAGVKTNMSWFGQNETRVMFKGYQKTDELDWTVMNKTEINYKEFITQFEDLIKAIDNWLNSHSDIKIKFNL